ncbi:MAG TPA: phosphopantetheine-binding protein [Steroidobacteraceae bacterium]|jgi:acyl carrier protein|nr:phosphopantetheine-binding protein [Steroidobacteraceae bacterium]
MSPAPEDQSPDSALRDRLLGLVERVLDKPGAGPSLPAEAALSELGVSSLKMVSLMLSVEAEFDLIIPQMEITPENFRSINSIHALVMRILATKS